MARSWKRDAIVSVLVPFLVIVVAAFLYPTVQMQLAAKAEPLLVRDEYIPDVSTLDPEVREQIAIVPFKYTLRHARGGPAEEITIHVASNNPLPLSSLRFTPTSEATRPRQVDESSVRIDVPVIRPRADVTFEVMTPSDSTFEVSELANNAEVLSLQQLGPRTEENASGTDALPFQALAGLVVIVWAGFILVAILVIRHVGKGWREMDRSTSEAQHRTRSLLIRLILGIMLYNLILGSFGMARLFVPLPGVSFNTLFFAFAFYLLVTRYRFIDHWLSRTADQTEGQGEGKQGLG